MRKFYDSKPFRFITELLCLIGFLLILMRTGFFPQLFELPAGRRSGQLQSDVSANSIFFLTGNSFVHFIEQMDKECIAPGTFHTLDLLNNSNTKTIASYNVKDDAFYIGLKTDIFRYKKTGEKALAIVEGKPTLKESYPFTLKYRNVFLQKLNDATIHLRQTGLYNGAAISFKDEFWEYADLAKILFRNETERITLREFLRIVLAASYDMLLSWDPDTNTAVFYSPGDDGVIRLYSVDAVTGEETCYTPLEDMGIDGDCFRLDSHSVVAVDSSVTHVYRLDFVQRKLTLVTEIPKSMESSIQFQILEDGSLIVAGTADKPYDPWVFIEKTGKMIHFKATEAGQKKMATALGTHSLMLYLDIPNKPSFRLCDFSEYLNQEQGSNLPNQLQDGGQETNE